MKVVSFRPIEGLEGAFGDVDVTVVAKRRYTSDELVERAEGADALFVHSENEYGRHLFERVPSVRVVAKAGSGIDNIDLEAATDHGVAVLHTPGMNAVAVAEYTVGAICGFLRSFREVEDHLRAGGWRSPALWGTELRGKTVGIVGLGAAGFETARRLAPFDVEFLVADPYVEATRIERIDGRRVDLETLLGESVVVSVHVRLTPETRGLIDRAALERMRPDALLVNTARGPVVDREALAAALEEERIGGAVLDVFHEEPPAEDDPLLELPNVMATPHVAGATHETRRRMLETTARAVGQLLAGEPVEGATVANPAVLEGH